MNTHKLSRGQWISYNRSISNTDLQATWLLDLKRKDFISTCSTFTKGDPNITKCAGAVNRPQLAVDYLKYTASIDKHNHVRTSSLGFEDI